MVLFMNWICHKVVIIYQTVCSQTRVPSRDVFYGGKPKQRIKLLYGSSAGVLADLFQVAYACTYLVKWSTMVNTYS